MFVCSYLSINARTTSIGSGSLGSDLIAIAVSKDICNDSLGFNVTFVGIDVDLAYEMIVYLSGVSGTRCVPFMTPISTRVTFKSSLSLVS